MSHLSEYHVLAVEPRGVFGANKDCTLGEKEGRMHKMRMDKSGEPSAEYRIGQNVQTYTDCHSVRMKQG